MIHNLGKEFFHRVIITLNLSISLGLTYLYDDLIHSLIGSYAVLLEVLLYEKVSFVVFNENFRRRFIYFIHETRMKF